MARKEPLTHFLFRWSLCPLFATTLRAVSGVKETRKRTTGVFCLPHLTLCLAWFLRLLSNGQHSKEKQQLAGLLTSSSALIIIFVWTSVVVMTKPVAQKHTLSASGPLRGLMKIETA